MKNLALSLVSIIVAILAGEYALRPLYPLPDPTAEIPLEIPCDNCGYVYGLNPAHPEISAQGLRDRLFRIPKPDGVFRILVLGDSVTYGTEVAQEHTYPKQLEDLLRKKGFQVEVINAGVKAYTPFNEYFFLQERGLEFHPDLVLIGFCLNDVVDPLPHWRTHTEKITVPRAAIPDLEFHDRVIAPRFAYEDFRDRFAILCSWGALLRASLFPIAERLVRFPKAQEGAYREVNGKEWPVYLTLEYAKKIDVLMDEESPEWIWLRQMYRDMIKVGPPVVPVVFPLAYQLDPGYPYLPQTHWARFCSEEKLDCIDPLPHWRQKDFFLRERSGYDDIWHLNEQGHLSAASLLAEFVEMHFSLPRNVGGMEVLTVSSEE